MCCAATTAVRKVIGLEVNKLLAVDARKNANKMRFRKAPIEIIECYAQNFNYEDGTVIFLFNPFGSKTINLLLDNLKEACERSSQTMRLIYSNPVHKSDVDNRSWLSRDDSVAPNGEMALRHDVIYWRTNASANPALPAFEGACEDKEYTARQHRRDRHGNQPGSNNR